MKLPVDKHSRNRREPIDSLDFQTLQTTPHLEPTDFNVDKFQLVDSRKTSGKKKG